MSTEAAAQPATIASDRYAYEHVVGPESIDAFRHVNNLVYLEWVLEAATRHSAARGWDVARYDRAGGAWIVRRHEIDYLRQAKEGDRLVVETWVESYTRITAQRMTEVRDADGQRVCACKTTWVYVARDTLRPARIPAELVRDFHAAT